jgi:hypothetical protein
MVVHFNVEKCPMIQEVSSIRVISLVTFYVLGVQLSGYHCSIAY